jgi:SAM-dependent methyltransferase
MGFDVQAVRFLLSARRAGVQFERTAMIGRQELFLSPGALRRILERFGMAREDNEIQRLIREDHGFAEPLLRLLGAEQICSIDASEYEHASVVHDLNLPIPDSLKDAFSAVIDAGTLEHVFNFPTALRNCMDMVRVGGHLLLMTPTNNFMGHGFYQFSPELFFRVCSRENGFEVVKMILCEVDPEAPWYEVVDPARAKRRVELVNCQPAYLLVMARKLGQVPVPAATPQQSDYTVLWQDSGRKQDAGSGAAPALPARVIRALGRRLGAAYQRIEPSGLAAWRRRPDPEVFIEINWRP